MQETDGRIQTRHHPLHHAVLRHFAAEPSCIAADLSEDVFQTQQRYSITDNWREKACSETRGFSIDVIITLDLHACPNYHVILSCKEGYFASRLGPVPGCPHSRRAKTSTIG